MSTPLHNLIGLCRLCCYEKHTVPQQINAYFVMTRGQAQATGTSVPEVHGHSKTFGSKFKTRKR